MIVFLTVNERTVEAGNLCVDRGIYLVTSSLSLSLSVPLIHADFRSFDLNHDPKLLAWFYTWNKICPTKFYISFLHKLLGLVVFISYKD